MSLSGFVELLTWVFMVGILLIIGLGIFTGRINARQLIIDKRTRRISSGRIQLLLFTIVGAFYYLFLILDIPNQGTLPPVPDELVYLVAGSNAIYLSNKMSLFKILSSWLRRQQ